MIHILSSLLFAPLLIFANPNQLFSENEDPTIFHHVNVITGNLNISFQDALIQGARPIPISRTYSSSGALERTPSNFDRIWESIRSGWIIQGLGSNGTENSVKKFRTVQNLHSNFF